MQHLPSAKGTKAPAHKKNQSRATDRSVKRAATTRGRRPTFSLPRNDRLRLARMANRVVAWFDENGRQFPWRDPKAKDYEQICVEVLLQRTRAETIEKYYCTFFRMFPSWHSLQQATTAELENTLMPIGLWQRRARALSGLANYATASAGRFPIERSDLEKIPAVGQYVANAILLFQHGEAAPLLDTNMARVIERYLRPRKLADIRYDPWLQAASHHLVASADPKKVNWAILDLGGMVCTPRSPDCNSCPLKRGCAYHSKQKHSKIKS
jgi:A/G-specific adenine glycosylase